jgi:hypothetical protein
MKKNDRNRKCSAPPDIAVPRTPAARSGAASERQQRPVFRPLGADRPGDAPGYMLAFVERSAEEVTTAYGDA